MESHSWCQITPRSSYTTGMSSGILGPQTQMWPTHWPPQTAAARNAPITHHLWFLFWFILHYTFVYKAFNPKCEKSHCCKNNCSNTGAVSNLQDEEAVIQMSLFSNKQRHIEKQNMLNDNNTDGNSCHTVKTWWVTPTVDYIRTVRPMTPISTASFHAMYPHLHTDVDNITLQCNMIIISSYYHREQQSFYQLHECKSNWLLPQLLVNTRERPRSHRGSSTRQRDCRQLFMAISN